MRGIVIRFLTFNVLNEHPVVYWGFALVWVLLIMAAISSLRSQSFDLAGRWIWFVVILFLPIGGLAAYCIFCLARADWSFMRFFLAKPGLTKTVTGKGSKI